MNGKKKTAAEKKKPVGKPERQSVPSGATVGKRAFKRRIVSKIYLIAAVALAAAAVMWALTGFFVINEINVLGDSRCTREEVIEASGLKPGDSLILFNKSGVEKRLLEKNVYIESVVIRRRFPDTLEITVTDKIAAAAFEANGAYWLVGENGTLLELSLDYPADAALVLGAKLVGSKPGEHFTCEDEARQILLESVFSALTENGLVGKITEIDIGATYSIVLQYGTEFDIVLGSAEKIADSCSKIEKVIAKAKSEGKTSGCFDMRDGTVRYTPERFKANILR